LKEFKKNGGVVYTANDIIDPDIKVYGCRVECDIDWERIQNECGDLITDIIKSCDERMFQSKLSLEELIEKWKKQPDTHIAYQSLMPIEKYTGERDYNR
jgi:hypothetical protein